MNKKDTYSLQPIAVNTGDFRKIRTNRQIYVDKTDYLYNLITSPSYFCYFLARPRRFGKSLMISTLKELFLGNRELFEGLAITRTDWQWDVYPVLHFNFGFSAATTYERFERNFPKLMSGVWLAS